MGLAGVFEFLRSLDVLDPEVLELDFDGVNFFVEVFVVFLYVEELLLAFVLLFFVLLLFKCLLLELFFELVDFIEF